MNDASGLLSKAWFALVAANSFAFIVTLTTSDSNFYLSTSAWSLPLINVTVTLIQFANIAPFILLGGQLYQLLVYRSLKRDWDALDDARRDDRFRELNWIVAGILGLPNASSRTDVLETRLKRLVFFWLGPATLIYLWARCLRFHDLPLTSCHVAIATLALGATAFVVREGRRLSTPAESWSGPRAALLSFALTGASLAAIAGLSWAAWYNPGSNPLASLGVPTILNLSGIDFSSAVKQGSDGSKHSVDFSGRDLRGANFSKAILPWASFDNARLDHADFESANLQGATMREASIADANFKSADFRNDAILFHVIGPRAAFNGANMTDANFHGARLCGAIFDDANLTRIDLADANLTAASFVDTVFTKAGFGGSSLLGAEIGGDIDLSTVSFNESDTCGARIFGQVQGCKADPRHVRPSGARGWPAICRDAYDDVIRP